METKPQYSMTISPHTPRCRVSKAYDNGVASHFECNICLDLAHDPVITHCGHLYCWPCLYKWLHIHSRSRDCPVCKALIPEDHELVPLYCCGKKSSNPRSNAEIPRRPAGHRPPTSDTDYIGPREFGFASNGPGPGLGLGSWMATRHGSYTFAAAFGGVIPWLRWDCES